MDGIKAQILRQVAFEKLKIDKSRFSNKEKDRIDMIIIDYALHNKVYNPD